MRRMGKEDAVDYYEILQVSPKAEKGIIERAFRMLAKRYHPDNKQTGDAEKFDILVEAYRVLSDPERRAAYDADHKPNGVHENDVFSNGLKSRGPEAEKVIHQVILIALYSARRRDVSKPGVGIVELEKRFGLPEKEMEFHIWYLKEKGWVQRLDTGELAI
ncbi:MAG: J domain-containing protein, partial [Deltaproteobacteria bacterium]